MCQETKTCSICQVPKPISEFNVVKKTGKNPYTESYCKTCAKEKRKAYDAKTYQKNREKRRAYDAERSKSPEYKKRQVQYKNNHKAILTNGFVAYLVSKKLEIPIPEVYKIDGLVEVERTKILLNRKIKSIESSDPNFRYCSRCEEKKPIEEYRVKTERKKGKEPYTYTSGQCIKCIREIRRNYYGNNRKSN